MKVKCFCVMCGKYIGDFYPSVKRKTCSEECLKKRFSLMCGGKSNPNWKHGNYFNKHFCKKCGEEIDMRAKHCRKCAPMKKGRKLTVKQKHMISITSAAKFTVEYKEKMRRKFVGRRKMMNGYVFIKDYNHANRNSQNNVLEHIRVMSDFLKRPLKKGEFVHHINMVRDDNRLENLYLCNAKVKNHSNIHSSLNKLTKQLLDRKIIIFENGEYKFNSSGVV